MQLSSTQADPLIQLSISKSKRDKSIEEDGLGTYRDAAPDEELKSRPGRYARSTLYLVIRSEAEIVDKYRILFLQASGWKYALLSRPTVEEDVLVTALHGDLTEQNGEIMAFEMGKNTFTNQ